MSTIKYGLIHCHSENSMKDSTLSVASLVKQAKKMGAPAVTLTDHGVVTGIFEFVRTAQAEGIKAIPGVEAYKREEGDIDNAHQILLAKDYVGWQAISRAVTASNANLHGDTPCMTMDILMNCFGPDAPGHGHVISTSACVGGILAKILRKNDSLAAKISKLEAKASGLSTPTDASYLGNIELCNKYHAQIEALSAERDKLKKIADRKFTQRERALTKMSGAAYDEEAAKLEKEKQESVDAAAKLPKVKAEIATIKRRETMARQAYKACEKEHEKWAALQAEIDILRQGLASPEQMYLAAKNMASEMAALFGENNFYIELQYHGIPEEASVMPLLAQIAKELHLPVVACNDVHYAEQTEACVRARKLVMSSRFDRWPEARPDDGEYYIKSDEQLRHWLRLILDEETVEQAMHGIADIVAACNVVFPTETHFPKFVGGIEGETSQERLRRLTEEGIKKRYPNGNFKYRDRVEYELDIINRMQYTDYLCIVQDYLEYGRQCGKDVPEGVGYAIGPGRGSAAGSLVCYLIGITSVDPMPLDLLFERFLNPDRVSSPDIDADLSPEVRERVLEYVKQKYGEEAVCCIMTKGALKAKAAIKAAARARGLEQDRKGAFFELGNSLAKIIPTEPGAVLADSIEDLRSAFPDNPDAQGIIDDALLLEGVAVQYGMHAAGVIIADNGDVGEYIPLMWNSANNVWVTSCDMVEAEAQAGLLKFDFLGLKNLAIISDAIRMIKRNSGVAIDIEKVPQEAEVYREIFAKGKTDFIFQFESDGMKALLKKFQPENLEHLVLLNAVFRPGPLQYADPICEVKRGKRKATYICKEAEDILKVTYGYAVFQEQIMTLCNKVADFTLGEADMVRRYMSKKKVDKLAEFAPKFIDGLVRKGVSRDKAEAFWVELMDFGRYCFNKSHAAVYATVAYYTAWLKYHYPCEYMAACLNWTVVKEQPAAVAKCRDLNLKVLPPDINRSSLVFSGNKKEILFGLSKIKHVGESSAEPIIADRIANGPFRSFRDFLKRTNPRQDVLTSLIDAGAMDCWCSNRAALKFAAEKMMDDLGKVKTKEKAIAEITEALADTTLTVKEREKLEKRLVNAKLAMTEYKERFDTAIIPISLPEDLTAKLAAESALLGMYVSGHPLDEYPEAKQRRTTTIAEATAKNRYVTVAGVAKNVRVKSRKSDNAPMGFFDIEDETDIAEGCCFTKAYREYGSLIEENAVLLVEGRLTVEVDDETGETSKKISIESIKPLFRKPKKLLVAVYGLPRWVETVYPALKPYENETGMEVVLYDCALGEYRTTTMRMVRDVLQEDFPDCTITEVDI